jgi:hypothetical protein
MMIQIKASRQMFLALGTIPLYGTINQQDAQRYGPFNN